MKHFSPKILFFLFITTAINFNATAISNPKNIVSTAITSSLKDSTVISDSIYANALKEFKNLSKAEKKIRTKEAKKMLKEYKQNKKNGDIKDNDILMAILCIFIPPLAVYIHEDKQINNKFWISLVLTLLIWIPGIIYSLLVVFGDL